MAELINTFLSLPSYLERRNLCTPSSSPSPSSSSSSSLISAKIDSLHEEYDDLESAINRLMWLHPTELDYYDDLSVRQGRKITDPLSGSEGGHGGGDCCPPVVDPKTLITLLGFLAAATFFLRMDVTKILGKRRRKRRGGGGGEDGFQFDAFAETIASWTTVEDLDLKLEAFSHGLGDDSLLGNVLKAFHVKETEANETVWEMQNVMSQPFFIRSASSDSGQYSNENLGLDDSVSKCNMKFWHCIATVVRNSFKYLGGEMVENMKEMLKENILKVIFNGGIKSPWDVLRVLPEIDKIEACWASRGACMKILPKEMP